MFGPPPPPAAKPAVANAGWVSCCADACRSAAAALDVLALPGPLAVEVAVLDALKMCDMPIIEVHISNIHQREEFRHHSFVSHVATGIIAGCGTQGYVLALHRVARLIGGA